MGIFLSLDPVEGPWTVPMALNGYSYVHGNPTNWTDPSGEFLPLLVAIGLESGSAGNWSKFTKKELHWFEMGAYQYEIILGKHHGFSPEYMKYLNERSNFYWGYNRWKKLHLSPTQKERFVDNLWIIHRPILNKLFEAAI